MSLVTQAAAKTLPAFQFMDTETVVWIHANRPPNLPLRYLSETKIAKRIAPIEVPKKWFAEPQIINTIHGLRHVLRTAINAEVLAREQNIDPVNRTSVIMSALLHDLRRLDDKADAGHAQRCAEWANIHWAEILNNFKIKDNEVNKAAVITAIRLHETPYVDIDDTNYEIHRICTDILKTADALDRYRLPKLKWWPQAEFIRLKPPKEFYSFSYDLAYRSEKLYIEGFDSVESIWKALKEICDAD